jgi:hypothetical protein
MRDTILRIVLGLHGMAVLVALGLLVLSYLIPPWEMGIWRIVIEWNVAVLAAVGVVTGFGLMALRKGPSESIWLALSTIAAFMLLIL